MENRPIASAESSAMSRPPRYASISQPGPSAPWKPMSPNSDDRRNGAFDSEKPRTELGRGPVESPSPSRSWVT